MCTRQEDKERRLESWHDGEQAARTEGVRKLSETLIMSIVWYRRQELL